MKRVHFEGRSFAWSSLGLFSACAIASASAGCRLELTDGNTSGSGGSDSTQVAAAGNGGATTSSGGDSSESSGVPSAGQVGAASGGAAGAGAGAAAGAGQSGPKSPSTNLEDCGNPDKIPNDDREHAVDFGSGATLCVTDESDSDWFYVDTPSDGRAHVIQLDLSETDDSWVDVFVTADKDGSKIGRIHPSQRGLKQSSFVTVGPGARTYFEVVGFVKSTDTTTIDVSVTAEADEHEPNNDRASATLIQPASEVSAQLIMPYVSETDHAMQDWYKAELAAGKHTFQMTAVPSDLYPEVQLSDSTDAVLQEGNRGPNRGAKFSFTFSVDAPGVYYFKVDNFTDVSIIYSGTKADSYVQPYKFQID